jgi:parallel beta-helix repeat protein
MRKGLVISICVLLLIGIFSGLVPSKIEAATIIVPDMYPTIQQAVDAANPGDTVYVRSGTYHENVVINKSITLTGENRNTTKIEGWASSGLIYVTSEGVNVTEFTLTNYNPKGGSGSGIELFNVRNCYIASNNVRYNGRDGILLVNSDDNLITNNIAYANNNKGIHLISSNGNTISYNIANLNYQDDGIYLEYSSCNNITHNTAYSEPSIHDQCRGVTLFHSDRNIIKSNNLHSNSLAGIHISYSDNNMISCNRLVSNGAKGLHFLVSNYNTIRNNNISYNAYYGIPLHGVNNLVYHNNIIGNPTQAEDSASYNQGNLWNAPYPKGGNFWGDYIGEDKKSGPGQNQSGSDGFGDTPYGIYGNLNNGDKYPLMEPWRTGEANQPPNADAGNDQTVRLGEIVQFDGNGSYDQDGDVLAFDWDFGDGSAHATGVQPTHIFQNLGVFTVSLIVSDDHCGSDIDTCVVTVLQEALSVIIDIDPDTLNLKSKGRWITCYIEIPSHDVKDIDIDSILLEDTIPAEWGDIQNDTLMVKFDRSEVEDMLLPGTYNLKVSGELKTGTPFEGYSDEIKVIEPP